MGPFFRILSPAPAKPLRAPWVLSAACMLAALALAPWDHDLSAWARNAAQLPERPFLSAGYQMLRVFGKTDVLLFFALVAGICGLKRQAVAVILALALTAALVWPLKLGVLRERPSGASRYSFPSGDTASAAAAVVPLVGRFPQAAPLALLVVGGVAAGRVLAGAHYPSDVAAGAAAGLIAGALSVLAGRRFRLRLTWRHFLMATAGLLAAIAAASAFSRRGDLSGGKLMFALVTYGPFLSVLVAYRLLRPIRRRQRKGKRPPKARP